MNLLFIHQNLPAQFKHLIGYFAANSTNRVVGIGQAWATEADGPRLARSSIRIYRPHRKPSESIHNYLYSTEESVLNGQAVASEIHRLDKGGFKPDLVLAHTGWGEALFVKDVLTSPPLIGYFEFFYRAHGLDTNFDPEFPISKDDELRLRTRNAVALLSLDACDLGVCPTRWQRDTYPDEYRGKLSLIHEGVDTQVITPDANASFELPNGQVLVRGNEVVTFAARSLEPYRGIHTFLRAVPEICRRRPNCQIVIAGGDEVAYGRRLPPGESWRHRLVEELDIDPARVHFVGLLPWANYLRLLQVSTVHVYLTVPFVLSWSMIEAMAAGAALVGSDTPPVHEVIQHGENGLLVDFFSTRQVADAVHELCENPALRRSLAAAARATAVRRFEMRDSLARYDQFFRRASAEIA